MIGHVITDSLRDWDLRLPLLMAAYRTSKHESLGTHQSFSYFFVREVQAQIDLVLGSLVEPSTPIRDDMVENP